jgi:hypothetical protein
MSGLYMSAIEAQAIADKSAGYVAYKVKVTDYAGPTKVGIRFDLIDLKKVPQARVTVDSHLGLPYMISTDLWIAEGHRGGPAAGILDALRDRISSMGAKKLIACVHSDNAPELSRMFKQNWRQLDYFDGKHIFVK